ncbi:MAG: chemotaxis protein CheB [Candidatus Velthaea sp.]|jgi:two-component system CheB/CheR fusion protein
MGNSEAEHGCLVVTGSSAGGIEALSVVLGALPSDFGAPVVVAQHLDPAVPSSLAAILGKHTKLHVVAVDDSEPLEPATVYVVPSDRQVEITDGCVQVRSDGQLRRPKPSIDLLFASAAAAFGERLIAVVLTGMGSDGRNGARAVKQHGGIVIIEDPQTASFPSMPGSLEPGLVDVIAPLDEIGPELTRLVGEASDLPDDLPIMQKLFERFRTTSGIDFSHYKMSTVKRRLARQMTLSGKRNLAEYLTHLTNDPAEFNLLASTFLIKVTEFFRDGPFFDKLRSEIVPELVEEARRRGAHELRVWSAGCATGEEAYSIAMLIAEAQHGEPDGLNVRVFGTDIDEAAISFARHGLYPLKSVAAVAPELVKRYFNVTEAGAEVVKSLRSMTVFGQHDLAQRAPFPRIDLALCRNVLIYFSKELQQRTLHVFAFSLRNGGYLALGKSETTNPLADYFEVVDSGLRIFRRCGERVTIPSAAPTKPLQKLRRTDTLHQPFPAFEPNSRDNRFTVNEKLGAFLTGSSIGVILVDRHYDILSINASARRMFNLHGVAIGEDLVHLVPPDASGLIRTVLDSALRSQQPTAGGEELEIHADDDEPRFLSVLCYPEQLAGAQASGAVILAVDVTEIAVARRASLHSMGAQAREMEELRRFQIQARERQRSLVEANQQLAQANSDLRAQNDALVINAEEAEAATEEIETLNEEMQATNEELETLNEEFQATIEELNTTNDEHEARARELNNEAAAREERRAASERAAGALAAIVDSLPAAVAAVDAQGAIVVANQRFRDIQAGATETSVQIDDDAGATIPLNIVLRRAGEGHEFSFTYRSIAADQVRSIYLGHARPLGIGAGACSIVELVEQR